MPEYVYQGQTEEALWREIVDHTLRDWDNDDLPKNYGSINNRVFTAHLRTLAEKRWHSLYESLDARGREEYRSWRELGAHDPAETKYIVLERHFGRQLRAQLPGMFFAHNNVACTAMDEEEKAWYRHTWIARLIPPALQEDAYHVHCVGGDAWGGYLWHAFSFRLLPCESGQRADELLAGANRENCVFFPEEGTAYSLPDASQVTAEFLAVFGDAYLTKSDFSWTYLHTHEYLGPYFYRRQPEQGCAF